MMIRRPTRTLERLWRYFWRFKLTPGGKALVLGGWVVGIIGSSTILVPVYQLFFALFFVGITAYLAGILYRPRLSIDGQIPEKISAGQTFSSVFRITNRSRASVYDVGLGFFGLPGAIREAAPAACVPAIPSGKSASLSVTLQAARRGMFRLPPIRAYSTFPFGICRAGSARVDLGSLLVLPTFHSIIGIDVPMGRRYQPGGVALTSNVGDSLEYIGNREYRPGDPVRKLDSRAWARLAKPVVKEFQEEYYCRIALVMDTFVKRPGPFRRGGALSQRLGLSGGRSDSPSDDLEAAVSLTAAIADALSRGEYIIDIFAAGPELYILRYGRNISHFDNVLEILAGVDVCETNPFDTVTPALADELAQIATVICVFMDWDESRRELVRTASEAGCSVKAFVLRDEHTTLPLGADEWAECVRPLAPEAVMRGGLDIL